MSNKRPRSDSPVSENTLLHNIEEAGLSVIRPSDCNSDNSDESNNILSSSESESSSDVVDDTDDDPDYDPDSANNGRPRLSLFSRHRPNWSPHLFSSDEENVDDVAPLELPEVGLNINNPSEETIQTQNNIGTRPTPPNQTVRDVQLNQRGRGTRPRGRGGRGHINMPSSSGQNPRNNRPPEPESSGWDEVTDETDPGSQHTFSFDEVPSVRHCPPRNSKPIEYFFLFFTHSLLSTLVMETNRYAANYLQTINHPLSPQSTLRTWVNISIEEMKGFLAVLFNMGIIRKPSIRSYWSQSSSLSTPWFSKMFTRTRFELILKFFHLVDANKLVKRGEPGYDPCGRFQPLIDHLNSLFKFHYTPSQKLSVDESLVGTKKRIALTQYLPKKKHHRWGVKLWVLCDAVTHYCMSMSCYKGAQFRDPESTEHGLGFSVVKKLLEIANCLNKGYHLFLDNFFTTLRLARFLYSKCTWLTGTVQIDRKGVPKPLQGKYKVGEKKYLRKGPALYMAYREKSTNKSQFILLSTNSKAGNVMYSKRRNGKVIIMDKPIIVHQYNNGMGGIDGTDQMLYTYMDERRSMKPWKKVIFNIFGRMMLNSYVLYKLNTDAPLSRVSFISSVIDELSNSWLQTKLGVIGNGGGGDAPVGKGFGLEKVPDGKEKNCSVCSGKKNSEGKRRRARTMCCMCKAGLHAECYNKHRCN